MSKRSKTMKRTRFIISILIFASSIAAVMAVMSFVFAGIGYAATHLLGITMSVQVSAPFGYYATLGGTVVMLVFVALALIVVGVHEILQFVMYIKKIITNNLLE
jgi:hypothetical protein